MINLLLSLVIILPHYMVSFEKIQLLENPLLDSEQQVIELSRLDSALQWTLNIPLVLGVIFMFRLRKAQSLRQFLPMGFMVAKIGTMVAIFLWHPPSCLFYLVVLVAAAIALPLPPFEGVSHVEVVTEDYVRGQIMRQKTSKHATIHVVQFCASWRDKSRQFAETYAQLSLQ